VIAKLNFHQIPLVLVRMFASKIPDGENNNFPDYSEKELQELGIPLPLQTTQIKDKKLNKIGKHKLYQEMMQDVKRNCPKIRTSIPAPLGTRIIAFGDLHGDWELTVHLLQLAKLVKLDSNGTPHWDANPPNTILVQVGDLVDRCRPDLNHNCQSNHTTFEDEDSDLRIMHLFSSLRDEAQKVGGDVYRLLGNHELMNVDGDTRYVSLKGITGAAETLDIPAPLSKEIPENSDSDSESPTPSSERFIRGLEARKAMFTPSSLKNPTLATYMGCTQQAVLIIGDVLFAHAGVLPSFLKRLPQNMGKLQALEYFNEEVRKWLLGEVTQPHLKELILDEKTSPFWNRILGKLPRDLPRDAPECKLYLDDKKDDPSDMHSGSNGVFKAFRLNKMVIGHTPQNHMLNGDANATCGNSLIRIDVGASRAFKNFDHQEKRRLRIVEIILGGEMRIIQG
jgi:hypothetical protein